MNATNPKFGPSRTIFRKRDGVYVVVRDEGRVTHNRLYVVKGDPLEDLVAEHARTRVVLEATTTGLATITGVAATTSVAATTGVSATTGVGDALKRLDVTSPSAEYAWSVQLRSLKNGVER